MPEVPCAFHPDRLTAVSCSNCGRPICPSDMTPAPVGYQCPVCTGRAREGAAGAASYRTREAVARRAERLPFAKVLSRAGVTQMLLAANVAIFVAMLFVGSWNDPEVLKRFGALPAEVPRSQWWRLITAMFVHVGPLHLLFNMYALMIFGPAIENRYGRLRFLTLYLAAGFLGSASSLLLTSGGVRAGASGGVFGILGAWIAFFIRHRSARGARDQLRSLFFLVGINLFIGVSLGGRIDNFAHLGGLAGGFITGTALELSTRRRRLAEQRLIALAGYALVIAGGIVALMASGRFVPARETSRLSAFALAISFASFWAIRPRWRGERISIPPKRSGGRRETCTSHPHPEKGITTTSAGPRDRPECQTPL
jgi:membrane associated rhomboid family serine protease